MHDGSREADLRSENGSSDPPREALGRTGTDYVRRPGVGICGRSTHAVLDNEDRNGRGLDHGSREGAAGLRWKGVEERRGAEDGRVSMVWICINEIKFGEGLARNMRSRVGGGSDVAAEGGLWVRSRAGCAGGGGGQDREGRTGRG